MKKIIYTEIATLICLILVAGCGSREKKNIVGSTGQNVVSTDSVAKVLTTDALDALKAVSKASGAGSQGPTNASPSLLSSSLVSTWQKPPKDADGYYMFNYTDSGDGTVYNVKVKPDPDWWDVWGGSVRMPWEDLPDGVEYTSKYSVKATFTGYDSSGEFTHTSARTQRVKSYPATANTVAYKGFDWDYVSETSSGEGIVIKRDNSWIRTKSSGTHLKSDPAGNLNSGPFSETDTQIMTFILSSGYNGKFDLKVDITGTHYNSYSQINMVAIAKIAGVIYLSGTTEIVKLYVEGKGSHNGGPITGDVITDFEGYYTTRDDNFTVRVPLSKAQLLSIKSMVIRGMEGGGKAQ